MKSESQEKKRNVLGVRMIIARKTGYSADYVGRVLNGRVNRAGKKARVIVEMAEEVKRIFDEI